MGRQMRYVRGVPLTGEERAGGGMGAGRSQAQGNMYGGGNPNVPAGAYGGAQDEQQKPQKSEGDLMVERLFGGGGQGTPTEQMLRQLIDRWRERERPSETLAQDVMLRDPVGYANKMSSLPSNAPRSLSAFAPGGAFEGRMAADTMTPAQIMASQGMNAKNQWASQMPAGSITGDVDTDELRRLNAQQRRTYF